MLCQSCGKETPPNLSYCTHCGNQLNLSFDEVQELMADQIQGEREESTESQIRQVLMATVFLILCIWIWNGLYQDPKTCHVVPFYAEPIVVGEKLVIPGSIRLIEKFEKNPAVQRPNSK